MSANLHVSSLGVYEARLNGRPVGPDVLSPGWQRVRMAAALPHIRRGRVARGQPPFSPSPWGTAGTGRAGLRWVPRLLRRPARRHRRTRNRVRGRHQQTGRQRRPRGSPRRIGRHRRGPVRRPDRSTPPSATADWFDQRCDPELRHAGPDAGVRHRRLAPYRRAAGQSPRGARSRDTSAVPSAHPRGLRQDPGGLADGSRSRVPRRRDPVRHAEVLGTTSSASAAPSAQAHRRFILSGEDDDSSSRRDLPRLPLRRGDRPAQANSDRRGPRSRCRHSDLRRTGTFECSDATR